MAETPTTERTIHIHRNQWHLAWDHSIPPIATIQSGETVSFDLLDASCGQIRADSTVDAIRTLDFSQVDQVNGPIYVEGAAPGDTLEIELLDVQPADWGCSRTIFPSRHSKSGVLKAVQADGPSLPQASASR